MIERVHLIVDIETSGGVKTVALFEGATIVVHGRDESVTYKPIDTVRGPMMQVVKKESR